MHVIDHAIYENISSIIKNPEDRKVRQMFPNSLGLAVQSDWILRRMTEHNQTLITQLERPIFILVIMSDQSVFFSQQPLEWF